MEETPLKRFIRDFCASRIALAGAVALLAVLFIALFAPWISPQNPYDLSQLDVLDAENQLTQSRSTQVQALHDYDDAAGLLVIEPAQKGVLVPVIDGRALGLGQGVVGL